MSYSPMPGDTAMGKTRSPWGVWWLCLITAGIYYLVWYVKLNKEIARAAGPDVRVGTHGLWISQLFPIAMWISLAHTAERLSTAQHRRGTAPTVSAGMTILSSMWFGSQTRYLQRRANQLWAYMAQQQLLSGAGHHSAVSAPAHTGYAYGSTALPQAQQPQHLPPAPQSQPQGHAHGQAQGQTSAPAMDA